MALDQEHASRPRSPLSLNRGPLRLRNDLLANHRVGAVTKHSKCIRCLSRLVITHFSLAIMDVNMSPHPSKTPVSSPFLSVCVGACICMCARVVCVIVRACTSAGMEDGCVPNSAASSAHKEPTPGKDETQPRRPL
jgi:hypothetical protein